MMTEDDKFPLSADEAESLLNDEGEYIHNFVDGGMVMLGCDFERDSAIKAFKAAKSIEIGGPGCKAMKHPIVVHDQNGRHSFFEADMAKVEALEASRRAGDETDDTLNDIAAENEFATEEYFNTPSEEDDQ